MTYFNNVQTISNMRMVKWISFGFILILFMQLTGCGRSAGMYGGGKDGPPPYDVDVSRIPNAIPKPVVRSRYGNPKSYVIKGRRYHVMQTHPNNYREKGHASWYGMKFHGRRTSSGEPYDLVAMTAAHKTLPIPSYVRVTNVKNGREVIVKVNDRGPFAHNRIIDLSYVAAKKLGIIGTGTEIVEVNLINPSQYSSRKG